ncbi:MAG: FAD-binding oxidoreductase [Thermoplasmata archaeon]|nr:FAD-binding oxidoreductase [Thermoplasmata archaeon]
MKDRIVIVGGGIMGLATAYHLARLGAEDITVLEKRFTGYGATFRTGTGIRESFGDETNIWMMRESIKMWKVLEEELDHPTEYTQTGYMFLLHTEEEVEEFKRNVSLQNSLSVPSRIISPEEAKEIVPPLNTSDVLAAAFNPEDGKANPFLVLQGYRKASLRLGVKIHEYTPVEGVVKGEKGWVVKTPRGDFTADILINAAGGWAKVLDSMVGVRSHVEPYKHQAIKTEPIKRGQINPMVVSFTHGGAYLTQDIADGGVIGGVALEEGPTFDMTPTLEYAIQVSRHFTHLIPALKYVHVIRQWAGFYAKTPDKNPVIGEVTEGYYVITGFSGHGFMFSPIATRSLAELIVEGKTAAPLDFYDPHRFERGELRQAAIQMG